MLPCGEPPFGAPPPLAPPLGECGGDPHFVEDGPLGDDNGEPESPLSRRHLVLCKAMALCRALPPQKHELPCSPCLEPCSEQSASSPWEQYAAADPVSELPESR